MSYWCGSNHDHPPFVHESLDIEPQIRTNGHDIFTIEPLQNRRLSGIIESTGWMSDVSGWVVWDIDSQKEDAHLPLLPPVLANYRKQTIS